MARYRVGIVGLGKMGRVYARWFAAHPQCEVAGVYNRTHEKAKAVYDYAPGAKIYDSWQALADDPNIDIVGLCSPSHERLGQVTRCLKNGKHVLGEKPFCMDVDEMKAMRELAAAAKPKVYVASQLKEHVVSRTMESLLARIGPVLHMRYAFCMHRLEADRWKYQLISGGGILRELCGHYIDMVQYWFGPARAVWGYNMIGLETREVEDFSETFIEFASGPTVHITSNYWERGTKRYAGRVVGKNGQMDYSYSPYRVEDSKITLYTDEGVTDVPLAMPDDIDDVYPGNINTFKIEIDNFVEAVDKNLDTAHTLEMELRTMQIIDASYLSTKTGSKIILPLAGFNSADELKGCYKRL
jgi:predicted dehydrogenase